MDISQRNDRFQIARLLDRHSVPELIALIHSEAASRESGARLPGSGFTSIDPSSRLSTATWHSYGSLISSTMSTSNSPMGFSETGSVTGSWLSDNTAPDPPYYGGAAAPTRASSRRSRGGARIPNNGMSHDMNGVPGPSISPSSSLRRQRPPVDCPFCSELGICISIARKADLKRHFNHFHNTNSQWICSLRGCQSRFDFKSAFDAHLKDSHQGIHLSTEDALVKTCPQVVFACGFTHCKQIFEASADDESDQKAQEYFNHIAKHLDEGLTSKEWSYPVRFRNLMRQSAVDDAWKNRVKGNQDRLVWQPTTSTVLRKMLETRHIGDVQLLVQWAGILGSFPYSQHPSQLPDLPGELSVPLRDTCNMAVPGHRPDRRPDMFQPTPQSVHPHHALNAPTPPQRLAQNPQQAQILQALPHSPFQSPQLGAATPGGAFGRHSSNAATPLQHSSSPFTPLEAPPGYQTQPLLNDAHHSQAHPLSHWTGIESLGAFDTVDKMMADLERQQALGLVSTTSIESPTPLGQYVPYDGGHGLSSHGAIGGTIGYPATHGMNGY